MTTDLVTQDFNGLHYTVGAPYASRVDAFLRELAATGYNIKSVQGYNHRNIAGTNTPSYHSFGAALDINPGTNPVNGSTDLPANIGEIAAKYGLGWGGNWTGGKTDPMHFSFAKDEGGAFDIARGGVAPRAAPGGYNALMATDPVAMVAEAGLAALAKSPNPFTTAQDSIPWTPPPMTPMAPERNSLMDPLIAAMLSRARVPVRAIKVDYDPFLTGGTASPPAPMAVPTQESRMGNLPSMGSLA